MLLWVAILSVLVSVLRECSGGVLHIFGVGGSWGTASDFSPILRNSDGKNDSESAVVDCRRKRRNLREQRIDDEGSF